MHILFVSFLWVLHHMIFVKSKFSRLYSFCIDDFCTAYVLDDLFLATMFAIHDTPLKTKMGT